MKGCRHISCFKSRLSFMWALILLVLSGCMKWDYAAGEEDFEAKGNGLFIINEGNFQYGNATLSYYDPETDQVLNEVFYRANAMRLGDVAQSMVIHGDKGWIVVNSSHVIFAIDLETFRETGRIENLTSPRYMHFIDDTKAYVTQLWDNRIFIVNPSTYSITGTITVPGMQMSSGSTEQMVQIGDYVYCTCWSYQNRIIKINTATDEVVDELVVGLQPASLVLDYRNRLWTLTDGGYQGSPYGTETPAIFCIDPVNFRVERKFELGGNDNPSELQLDGSEDTLYWINGGIWRMSVEADELPAGPFIESRDTKYYGLTIDPYNGDVYVADAIDYSQQGMVYRYTWQGVPVDEFYVGITPGAFCWK